MKAFITAATFNYPHEIEILKHQLNLKGIAYYFQNETATSVAPMYSIAFGGIKLKVHANDLEIVNEILNDLNGNQNLKIV